LAAEGIWFALFAYEYQCLKYQFNSIHHDPSKMNTKTIFGALLTMLGIGGLIYAAILFANRLSNTNDYKSLIIFLILGLIFFIAGISLVRTIKE